LSKREAISFLTRTLVLDAIYATEFRRAVLYLMITPYLCAPSCLRFQLPHEVIHRRTRGGVRALPRANCSTSDVCCSDHSLLCLFATASTLLLRSDPLREHDYRNIGRISMLNVGEKLKLIHPDSGCVSSRTQRNPFNRQGSVRLLPASMSRNGGLFRDLEKPN
jgi:hypothetical protein